MNLGNKPDLGRKCNFNFDCLRVRYPSVQMLFRRQLEMRLKLMRYALGGGGVRERPEKRTKTSGIHHLCPSFNAQYTEARISRVACLCFALCACSSPLYSEPAVWFYGSLPPGFWEGGSWKDLKLQVLLFLVWKLNSIRFTNAPWVREERKDHWGKKKETWRPRRGWWDPRPQGMRFCYWPCRDNGDQRPVLMLRETQGPYIYLM